MKVIVALVLCLAVAFAAETITYTTYTADNCGGVPTSYNYTPDECKNNVLSSGSVKATETLGVITVYTYTQSDCGDNTPKINTYTSGNCQNEKVGTIANSFKWEHSAAGALTVGLVQLAALIACAVFTSGAF